MATEIKFYASLSHEKRDSLFAVMRELDETALRHHENALKLWPPRGSIAVGGAQFDENLKWLIISLYLISLRCGSTPDEALKYTQEERTKTVKKWNGSREWQVHRSLEAEQSLIDHVHRQVLQSISGNPNDSNANN